MSVGYNRVDGRVRERGRERVREWGRESHRVGPKSFLQALS